MAAVTCPSDLTMRFTTPESFPLTISSLRTHTIDFREEHLGISPLRANLYYLRQPLDIWSYKHAYDHPGYDLPSR
jgi:hypothetical protein